MKIYKPSILDMGQAKGKLPGRQRSLVCRHCPPPYQRRPCQELMLVHPTASELTPSLLERHGRSKHN